MKEYLFAVYEERSILLELSRLKELHTSYVRELNTNLFQNSRPPIEESPQQITELLFRNEEYIIRWVEHNISWQALKILINPVKINYQQWQKAKKQVFFK